MPSLISTLNKTEQQELLEDLNYLNVGEIRTFCKEHAIPYTIYIETEDGNQRKTSDKDRKGIDNWKEYRTEKAKAVLDILDNLPLA